MANILGYYKGIKGRNSGKKKVVLYYAVMSNGKIKTIDSTRGILRHNLSFGSQPVTVEESTKEEFMRELYLVNKMT